MATIRDVAKDAGVSIATVSRVVNNLSNVQKDTREKVMNAIKKLNFNPNILGRNLRRMETKMALVLSPDITNPFFSNVVKGIEDEAVRNGYNILICNTNYNFKREYEYFELLKNKLTDGVIFIGHSLESTDISEIAHKFPLVQCCEFKKDANLPFVTIDDFAAAYMAVNHLISIGRKKIGLLTCDSTCKSTVQRVEGYKKCLKDAGMEFDSNNIIYGCYNFISGLRATKQLLSKTKGLDALFAINDLMAIGAMAAIKEAGLRIPQDIALVGFDDISMASMCDPTLTTIAQPKYDMGCLSMQLLLKQIKGGTAEIDEIILEHELVIRQSTIR
jgi:LacI family transcriptional regulator, repressor for deo operon, udp, cdd, tsx, nupC, and nupG